jgi:hypothetical protein
MYDIKDILREAMQNFYADPKAPRNNAVCSERATGKSVALVQFVAERLMTLHPAKEVGVVVPNSNIGKRFEDQFLESFPRLRRPIIAPCGEIGDFEGGGYNRFRGHEIAESYAEEMFLISPRIIAVLEQQYNFVAGVGTLHRPVGIRIRLW